ncbi:hypothetical protein [Streptomyces spiramenti]|uniref:Uncharacterized protein n=1 Tax=Streptomyces spiramenti TaxID=2720606 RepID=A0ABX1APN5_9ACTN|nr:hypothetical protein [Streptomyces spiramenti]NJP67676.1 hypothetical protein [Streptomyces spiramenti]
MTEGNAESPAIAVEDVALSELLDRSAALARAIDEHLAKLRLQEPPAPGSRTGEGR